MKWFVVILCVTLSNCVAVAYAQDAQDRRSAIETIIDLAGMEDVQFVYDVSEDPDIPDACHIWSKSVDARICAFALRSHDNCDRTAIANALDELLLAFVSYADLINDGNNVATQAEIKNLDHIIENNAVLYYLKCLIFVYADVPRK